MKKNFLIFATMLALAFSYNAFALGSSDASGNTIALCMSDLGNPFFHVLKDAVINQGKKLGYKTIVYDGQNDASKQPTQVEDAIQKGVKAIVIVPGDESSTANALKDAIAQNIPVVTVDREVRGVNGILSYLVTDNVKGGELCGKWLAEKMPAGGDVIIMEGLIGTAPQRERGGGFRNIIDPKFNKKSKFKIIDSPVGDFSLAPAEAAMQDMLAKHKKIDAVFAENDTMAVGIVRAIETAGRLGDGILVIGFDGSKEAYDLIKQKKMAVTAVQDFVFMGTEAVNYIDNYLKTGTKPKSHVLIDVYMSDKK